jgi:hypothetical protein
MRGIALFCLSCLALVACSRDPSPFGQELSSGRDAQGDPIIESFAVEMEDTYFEYLPATYDWDDLAVGKWEGHEQRLLLGFSGLPEDATSAQEAELTITITHDFLDQSLDVRLYEIARKWVDDEVSWINAQFDSAWTAEGGDFGAEISAGTISPGDSTVVFDLSTAVVNGWIGESREFNGIALVSESDGGAFAIENSAEAGKAVLFIRYLQSGGGTETYEERHSRSAAIGQTSFQTSGAESTLVIGNVNGFASRIFVSPDLGTIPDSITVARAVLRFHIESDSTDVGEIEKIKLWRVCGEYEGEDTEICSGDADQTAFSADSDVLDVEIGEFGDFLGNGAQNASFLIAADKQEIAGGNITVYSIEAAESLRPALYLTYTVHPGFPWP